MSFTSTCAREEYSEEITVLPHEISRDPVRNEVYVSNFNAIGEGLVLLGTLQSIFNVRFSTLNMKQGVEESIQAFQKIHENQLFMYRIGISLGSILERAPGPDEATTSKSTETDVVYFRASANNFSLFWIEEHDQSTYRYVTGQSDVEDIIRFLRKKEWVSRRADTSWYLVGHLKGTSHL